MNRRSIDQTLIAEDIEGLTTGNLKKAFRRYKNDTSKFRRKNIRDPIDHLDFELNLANEINELKNRLENGDYHPKRPLIHYSPKKHGISRPTVSLHIEDVIVYRFCIEQIDQELIAITRQENIRGGVMASPTPEPDDGEYYEKWFEDWLAHNKAVKQALGKNNYIATSDISSYFDNVDVEVLIDMLRETVKGKRNLLSLLSFFLHGVKLRYTYATRLNTGLVQDDSDSSRILAYFYLHPHDIRMINFTKKHKAHFFRYVDDMNVVVKNKPEAQLALKTLTDSLRKLGLIASIEKTIISNAQQAVIDMRYKENEEIQTLHDEVIERLRKGGQTKSITRKVEKLYLDFKGRNLDKDGTWIKLLRRFYTMATQLKADFLFNDISEHLEKYPSLAATGKLQRYFIANQNSIKTEDAVEKILMYCDSPENLYPQVETELIELMCSIELTKLSVTLQIKIQDLAQRLALDGGRRHKNALSEFSRGISAYLLYKCDPTTNVKFADQYTNIECHSEYVRKCWALVGLTSINAKKRKEVVRKLNSETSIEMKRLGYMISNLKSLRKNSVLQKYKNGTNFYLWGDEWEDAKGKKHKKKKELFYMPIRVRIIRDILKVNR